MKGSISSRQIKYGSLISYTLIIINIALGLFYTPWILREVGSSNYGLYIIATSLISLFLLDFGMSAAITRFLSKYRAENNQEKIDSFTGLAIKLYIGLCFIVALISIIVYINIESIYGNLTDDEISTFKIVFIISSVFIISCFPVNICNGILNSYEQYICLKASDVLNRIGTVIVTIIVLSLHGGIYSLILINGLFNLLTFALKVILVWKLTPVRIKFNSSLKLGYKEIISFSLWSTIQSLAQKMIYNIMPSLLAMVTNTLQITMFGFASTIEGYVYTITQAINGLFLPRISRIVVNEEDASKTLPLMIKVGRINQSVISLLTIGLIVLGKEFVHVWLGDDFPNLYYCIILICFPYFFSASQQIANSSIIAMNKIKYSALIHLISGLLNLGVSFIIGIKWGVVGVCFVISFISIIRIIAINIVYVKVLKINIKLFFVQCHIKMMPAIILCFVVSLYGIKLLPPCERGGKGWILFFIKASLLGIIYVISMWLIGWNKEEKNMFKSILKLR